MDIYNSSDVKIRVGFRYIIIAVILYSFLFIYTLGIAAIPAIFIWIYAYHISKKELDLVSQSSTDFNKSYPFRYFGVSYGNFSHVFQYKLNIRNLIIDRMQSEFSSKTPVSNFQRIKITDVDPDLKQKEERSFMIARAPGTKRGTHITFLIRYEEFGQLQSIQWWGLAGGYVDRAKCFNFVAYAPLTIWFWIPSYLKNEYDVVSKLRTIHNSAYNNFDVETCIKSMHELVFDSLIKELDNHGIDTTILRNQKLQMMNINISGGHVNMGSVVQGVMTNIGTTMGGGKNEPRHQN